MRTRTAAAYGSALFFVVAPFVVAGLVPWALTGYHRGDGPDSLRVPAAIVGGVLIVAGLPVLVSAFVRFVIEGVGTPAPVAPTQHLVVGGLYRWIRNPMYIAVLALIVGQAGLFWRPAVLVYAVIVGVAVVGFVLGYEQPTLQSTYGQEYDDYRAAVPGWYPRRPRVRGR